MGNIRLVGLLVIVFIISSCAPLSGSFALSTKHTGGLAYAPLVDGDSSFLFSTPTPIPSPTPEPTATPIPTPRPEPTAKPTLEMYCRSTAAVSNLKVEVAGTLTYNKTGISAASIYVGYSADQGNNWENFTLVQTRADGGFGAVWIPNATGNYLVCAQWEGNSTLHWVNATVNLALKSDSGNIFSVVSNSTISNIAYNSTLQELSFNTNGSKSTTGYVFICIPKALASDADTLEVRIDGTSIPLTSESKDDVWLIYCEYAQSEHAFTIQIPFSHVLSPAMTPWLPIAIVIVLLVAIVAILMVIKRKRRTAATVESILKQDRPVF